MIQPERIRVRNQKPVRGGKYVLYWMQQSQREHYNHALEHAIDEANALKKPVVVVFGITENYPEANLRHYQFMLEGLRHTQAALAKRGILMVVKKKSPELVAAATAKDACMVVCDSGYTRVQRQWRKDAAARVDCRCVEVESDVVVPVEEAAPKEQYTAGVLRPKITGQLEKYLVPVKTQTVKVKSVSMKMESFDISDTAKALKKLKIDTSVRPSEDFHGGTGEAQKRLADFIAHRLATFADCRNDPSKNCLSNMSPYLHFGQISPLFVALEIGKHRTAGAEAYLEELIVRRELGANFVYYNKNYDSFEGLPQWAQQTLERHKKDVRKPSFSMEELELGQTYDPYWNAAQLQMVITGKMHGYMRMYWGKKIIEWVKKPQEAYRIALELNNKYEIDGRDPNGFAGVAWCFGKHDRLWQQRPIFGKVRYMNAAGLERKFDIKEYATQIERLVQERR